MMTPLLYIDEDCSPIPEVYRLINAITDYYSQCEFGDVDLTVSNNEWRDIPGLPGCRERTDITFPLIQLAKMEVKKDKIIFTLHDDTIHSINISDDFFYTLEEDD